jgi:hypothetical protein
MECERSSLITRLQLDNATHATHNETQLTRTEHKITASVV